MGRRKGSKNKPKIKLESQENNQTLAEKPKNIQKNIVKENKKDNKNDDDISGYLLEIKFKNEEYKRVFRTLEITKNYVKDFSTKKINEKIISDSKYKPKSTDTIFCGDIYILQKYSVNEILVKIDNINSITIFENNGKYLIQNNLQEVIPDISKY